MAFDFDEFGRLIILALLAAAVFLAWLLSQSRGMDALRWVEVQELSARLKGRNNITIIDVRTRGEFTGPLGHIRKAMNIPLNELPHRINELSAHKDKPIIVVCRTHRRASRAAVLLNQAGMGDVSVLRGGMLQWHRLFK